MDCRANNNLFFLADEKFDFDVSLSPASSKGDEDEDEVFIGPVGHTERCVSVNVASRLEGVGGIRASWSPLSGDQLEAVCQEAHKLVDQLQGGKLNQSVDVTTDTTSHRDEFVQDTEAKLGMLDRTPSALSPIKRQTFCVQDSPMKQLPPAVQRRLLRGSSTNTASSTRPASTNTAPSSRPASTNTASSRRTSTNPSSSSSRLTAAPRLSTSSPMAGVKPQLRTGLRGRAALGVVLPSKPAAPTRESGVQKTRLQPPSKAVGGWKRSPSSRPSSRAGSSEDLLSDSASVASDISDSSFNSSLQGKHMLAPPTKSALRNMSSVKAPPLQRRRMTERNNTSSSSSSVSSFNSSISLSPAKGRLNSSLNRSVSGPAPGSISRPAVQSRPRRSTVTAEPASAGRRSLSLQNRKLPEVEGVKPARSTLLKRADSTPVQSTPAKRGLEKTGSMPARPQSALRSRSKPEALAVLTPGGGFRGVRNGDAPDVSKMLKPKALTSVSSVDSLSGPLTPSAGGCKSLQLKPRRPSALPTPVKRRMSAIPVATPTTKSRPSRLPSNPGPACIPAPIMRERSCSPAPMEVQEAEPVEVPDIQPFCLEEEEEERPAAPPTSSPQPDQSERPVPAAPSESQSEAGAPSESPSEAGAPSESPSEAGAPSHTQLESAVPATPIQSQSEPSRNLIEQETKEERHHKTQEVLLLDLPTPMLHPQEKLLIDLTNTPDLIRTSNKSCTNTQLIDLTSPLIKWSPEDKRENNAPLINLSF